MNEILKKINIKDGKIVYTQTTGYSTFVGIQYAVFNEKRNIEKILKFNMWDDFSFSGFPMDENYNEKTLEFQIDKDNLLFEPILKFLDDKKEFLLDDDESLTNEKTMQIKLEEDIIKINFTNNKSKKECFYDNSGDFNVFIKNIMYDGRSKLDKDKNDTKQRLWNMINDMIVAIAGKEILEENLLGDIRLLDEKMIFKIIPELRKADGFAHKHPHHCYDVWKHTKVALEKSKPDLQIRLALLLHDIGKPHSYWEGEDGVRHFPGHPEKSEEMSREILTRLGYEQEEIDDICYLVEHHDTIIDVDNLKTNNIELIKKQLYIQYCDAYAHHPDHIEKRIKKLNEIKEKLEEKIRQIAKIEKER